MLRIFLFLLRSLCAVLGTSLESVGNSGCIKSSSDDVISHTRKILDPAASDKDDTVFLQIVSDSGNVGGNFHSVCKSYPGDLSERGVPQCMRR